ncbi:bifunctional diguanylate cyclase/phosphodiesterase [Actimicrobium sp. GrIS 1.19]|uniref:bifunctional diguanylate cyclase/phosphodiesterase n=1 Tax=Actimicrobium sp. GrIS 1.19 TaxID=3071708 RepID=UPI002E15E6CA
MPAFSEIVIVGELPDALGDALCVRLEEAGQVVVRLPNHALATLLQNEPADVVVLNIDAIEDPSGDFLKSLRHPATTHPCAVVLQTGRLHGASPAGATVVRSSDAGELAAQINLIVTNRRLQRQLVSLELEHAALARQVEQTAAARMTISEQYHQSLFDNHPDAVYLFDLDGKFVTINRRAEQMAGYPREGIVGASFAQLIAPDRLADTLVHFQRAVGGESAHYQTAIISQSGKPVHLQVTNVPVVVDGKIVSIYGVARDISEQIIGQQERRVSEERFRNVARATTDTVWDWDLTSDAIWWNDGMQSVFGYPEQEIEADISSWTSRIHPDDLARVTDGIHTVIDGVGTSWIDEHRFRRHDGSYADVADRGFVIRDAQARAVRMVGGISDVTPRRQAEQRVARLNRALRMLSACNQVVVQATPELALLAEVCRIVCELGGYRVAWVGYARQDAACSIEPMAQVGLPADFLSAVPLSWSIEGGPGKGPAAMTIRSGEATMIENAATDPAFASWREHVDEFGFRGVVCLPLREGKHTFGVLALYATEANPISSTEMSLLCELADNLAFGIVNRRVQDERQRLQVAVEKVAIAVSATTSDSGSFFAQLARSMTEAVGARAGFIGSFTDTQCESVQIIAAVIDDETVSNFSCSLRDTTFAKVLSAGHCAIDDAAPMRFPGLAPEATGHLRSFVGLRLDDADGMPVGVLFVCSDQQLQRVEHTLSTLRIVGARVGAELAQQMTNTRMRSQAALLDHATDAIMVRDMLGAVTFWNQGAERLYGWGRDEALDMAMITRSAEEALDLHEPLERVQLDGEWRGELLQRRKDGGSIAVEARWTLIRDEQGQPSGILAIESDISKRKAAEHALEHLAFYDPLTDLPNRMLLRNRLQHAIDASDRSYRFGALLCINLDNFKALNDSLGHDMGDLLLQLVAVRLSYCMRACDTVARLSGDEFVILLVDLGDTAAEGASRAKQVAEKIIAAFGDAFLMGEHEAFTTPSIGITLFSNASCGVDELLQRADLAMYQAKASGRNTMQFFDSDMQATVSARMALESEMRSALKLNQFLLHFQPQVDANGMPTGAEALVRWHHPVRGLVPPGAFIPLAEENGLIIPLGNWVLETACRELAKWALSPALSDLTLAVNVSARQFRQPDFVANVLAVVHQTGINPRRLKLELTESLLIDNVEDTVLKMCQLKAKGVGFSLDDFGIGYSSLSYLKRLPLDQLKIDQSFVRDILTDPNDEAIARTIVALGNSLGLAVIAEGVETLAQKQRLATLGCFFYQGYFFSRPVPTDAFIAYIANPVPAGN